MDWSAVIGSVHIAQNFAVELFLMYIAATSNACNFAVVEEELCDNRKDD